MEQHCMSDMTPPNDRPMAPTGGTTLPVRRHPGHRGADVRDTVAEMAAKAQEISMEAGSKMAAAMKDVINAAAGLASFSLESSRDLVQFMVRRSQMTQDEADKLIASAEEATRGRSRKGSASKGAKKTSKAAAKKPATRAAAKKAAPRKPVKKKPVTKK
jgi:polyhydroxyalkanoate synthesis regulator phasin